MNKIDSLKNRIMFGGGLKEEDNFVLSAHSIMETYGMSYFEFMELPIPTYQTLVWCLKREEKAQEKAMKKKGRK